MLQLHLAICNKTFARMLMGVSFLFNLLRPNSDLSQTSHCNIKDLSVSEIKRI